MRRRPPQAPPSWPPQREIKLHSCCQTCVCVYACWGTGGGRRELGALRPGQGDDRLSPETLELEKGESEGQGVPDCRMFSSKHRGL